MIKFLKCKETKKIYHREYSLKLPQNIQRSAMKKLWMLDATPDLNSLSVPPSNHLEVLLGKRLVQHSIRINRQYCICFRWQADNAYDVEIVDYF
jgi:toxin HigB-1